MIAFRERRCVSSRGGGSTGSRDAVLPQLRQKRRRPSGVRKGSQRSKGVLGAQREHSTERVGINANPAELAQ